MDGDIPAKENFIEDEAAVEEWVGSRPFLILFNAEVKPRPTAHNLPREVVDQLNGRRPMSWSHRSMSQTGSASCFPTNKWPGFGRAIRL